MGTMALYIRYIAISIRSQMQYRASFIMLSGGHFLLTILEFAAVWVLFERFGHLQGWTLAEIALFYGMVNIAFALAEALTQGFEQFHLMVKSGDFDRLLLRPRSTVLQVTGQQLELRRVGRFLQALIVLVWAAGALGLALSPAKLALIAAAIIGGTCLFAGVFVLQATMSFWTTETIELMNSVTNGGAFAAQYPLVIYRTWFRRFFTYIIPLACVSYYPALAILDRVDPLGSATVFQWVAPLVGFVFLLGCLQLWHVGVRRYRSTGS